MIDLTTTARCGTLIKGGTLNTAATATLTQLVTEISRDMAGFMDRETETGTYTEFFDVEPDQRRFYLKAWPITSITSVHFDIEQGFNAADLLDADDYTYSEDGVLWLKRGLSVSGEGTWPRSLKVVYEGGMAADAASFVAAYPDLAGAAEMQIVSTYNRRNELGRRSVSVGGGQGGVESFEPIRWLPAVKATMKRYRRMMCG